MISDLRSQIHVVPDGVDISIFRPCRTDGTYRTDTTRPLTILYVGGTIWRKGIDIALECYIRAFQSASSAKSVDALLLVKDMGSRSFYAGNTMAARVIAAVKDPANPPIA